MHESPFGGWGGDRSASRDQGPCVGRGGRPALGQASHCKGIRGEEGNSRKGTRLAGGCEQHAEDKPEPTQYEKQSSISP